jgi:hypothetical protein
MTRHIKLNAAGRPHSEDLWVSPNFLSSAFKAWEGILAMGVQLIVKSDCVIADPVIAPHIPANAGSDNSRAQPRSPEVAA